jgi:hypothetical protein
VSTPFDARYGTTQGRIIPTDGPPFEGSQVMQLGSDVPGVVVVLNDGDYHMISQVVGGTPLSNRGFETAGASSGLAANWTVTIVATAQRQFDFGAGSGLPPTPSEDFDWFAGFKWFFKSGDTMPVAFNTGLLTSTIEGFEHGWPGVDGFLFFLGNKLSVIFTGFGQTGVENFEKGWHCDQFFFTFGPSQVAPTTFSDGPTVETFGDTLVASVVASTDLFTAYKTPDDGTPLTFRSPTPSGITFGTTYYVVAESSTTFKVSTTLGGSAVDVTLDATGVLIDIVGVRSALPDSGWAPAAFEVPGGGTEDYLSFEAVRGTYAFTVDISTSTIFAPGHSFGDGDEIVFTGPGLPTGSSPPIVAGVVFYVIGAVGGLSFQVSATSGGSLITITTEAGTGATVSGNPAVFWNSKAP